MRKMELVIKRLNIKGYLFRIIKKFTKKMLSPMDFLFLTLSGLFIGIFIFELSSILYNTIKNPDDIFHYFFQLKYQLLFGFVSVIFFISTCIIWIKQKVKSLVNFFIPIQRKKSLHWVLLIIAFALNFLFFILN